MKNGKGSPFQKILCLVLCLALLLGAAGCAREEEAPSQPEATPAPVSSAPEEPAGPYQIGVLLFSEDPTLTEIRAAFQDRLEEWGLTQGEAQVEFQLAGGEETRAREICQSFVSEKKDLIVALGDGAALAAAEAARGEKTQVFFVGREGLADKLGIRYPDSPEGNVTGLCAAPTESALLELALQAAPGLKTLGVLTQAEYAPSCADALEALKQACAVKKIEMKEMLLPQGGDTAALGAALAGETQAVVSVAGGMADQAAPAAKALLAAKRPWLAGAMAPVRAGALGCLAVPAEELGKEAADAVVELMAGRSVSRLPVETLSAPQVTLNQPVLEALHIQLDPATLDAAQFISAAPVPDPTPTPAPAESEESYDE